MIINKMPQFITNEMDISVFLGYSQKYTQIFYIKKYWEIHYFSIRLSF